MCGNEDAEQICDKRSVSLNFRVLFCVIKRENLFPCFLSEEKSLFYRSNTWDLSVKRGRSLSRYSIQPVLNNIPCFTFTSFNHLHKFWFLSRKAVLCSHTIGHDFPFSYFRVILSSRYRFFFVYELVEKKNCTKKWYEKSMRENSIFTWENTHKKKVWKVWESKAWYRHGWLNGNKLMFIRISSFIVVLWKTNKSISKSLPHFSHRVVWGKQSFENLMTVADVFLHKNRKRNIH